MVLELQPFPPGCLGRFKAALDGQERETLSTHDRVEAKPGPSPTTGVLTDGCRRVSASMKPTACQEMWPFVSGDDTMVLTGP